MTMLKDGRLMLLYASKDVFEPVGTSALRAVYSSAAGRTWSGARDTFRDARFNPGPPSLTETDQTVRKIASACGFVSAAHFQRQFQRRQKRPPLDYRAAVRRGG